MKTKKELEDMLVNLEELEAIPFGELNDVVSVDARFKEFLKWVLEVEE